MRHAVVRQALQLRHPQLQSMKAKHISHHCIGLALFPSQHIAPGIRLEPILQIYNPVAHDIVFAACSTPTDFFGYPKAA
jgi:hypothetical protein